MSVSKIWSLHLTGIIGSVYPMPTTSLDTAKILTSEKVQLSFNLINYLILPLVKASLIMLLLRVGSIIDRVRIALYALLGIVTAAAVIPWLIMLFMCPPRTGNTWAATTFGGAHCVNRVRIGELQIFVTSFSLLTDLLVLPIPFIISQKLVSLSLRSRLVIGAIFASTLA